MKKILFLICAITLFSASFVSAVHAHADNQNEAQQIETSINQNNNNSANASDSLDPLCDIHCHSHMAFTNFIQDGLYKITSKLPSTASENITSSLIHGLKRPPKI